jgi:hypothetical protein
MHRGVPAVTLARLGVEGWENFVDHSDTPGGDGGAAEVCRAALERGPLIRHRKHWRFGRRLFSNATVNQLIAEGAAVRDGATIRRADWPA